MQAYFFVLAIILGALPLLTRLLYLAVARRLAGEDPQRKKQLFNTILAIMKRDTMRIPDFFRLPGFFRGQNLDAKAHVHPPLPTSAQPFSDASLHNEKEGSVGNSPPQPPVSNKSNRSQKKRSRDRAA
jgi:hypothetical protein